jgi:hypothetical protein
MNDGGMGSLLLLPDGDSTSRNRRLGRMASECEFIDSDGIPVLATLNLDTEGNLYELDMWKTNFEKLIAIPAEL